MASIVDQIFAEVERRIKNIDDADQYFANLEYKDEYKYCGMYIEKYGHNEPLMIPPAYYYDYPTEKIGEIRNTRARICIEAGKTATELGLIEKDKQKYEESIKGDKIY